MRTLCKSCNQMRSKDGSDTCHVCLDNMKWEMQQRYNESIGKPVTSWCKACKKIDFTKNGKCAYCGEIK